MNRRKEYLRRHREWLISQAAAQRSEVSDVALDLQKSLRWVELAFSAGRALRAHPLFSSAGVSLLLPAAKTGRLRWVGHMFTAWEIFGLVRKQWPVNQGESPWGRAPFSKRP